MTLPLEFLPEADVEILDAFGWYECRRPGLGHEFLGALDAVLVVAAASPRGFPKVARRTRKALLRRFPYLVLHVVDESRILVTGVLHGHRDPDAWSDRVREPNQRYAMATA